MKDFKLNMQENDCRNEIHYIYGKFSKLEKEDLCFIRGLKIVNDHWYCKKNKCSQVECSCKCDFDYDCDECEYCECVDALEWFNQDNVDGYVMFRESTREDIERFIKEFFDYHKIKYDYVKVELL